MWDLRRYEHIAVASITVSRNDAVASGHLTRRSSAAACSSTGATHSKETRITHAQPNDFHWKAAPSSPPLVCSRRR